MVFIFYGFDNILLEIVTYTYMYTYTRIYGNGEGMYVHVILRGKKKQNNTQKK